MARFYLLIIIIGLVVWFGLIVSSSQNITDSSGGGIKILRNEDSITGTPVPFPSDLQFQSSKDEAEVKNVWDLFLRAKAKEVDPADNSAGVDEILFDVVPGDTNNDEEREFLLVTKRINSSNNRAETVIYVLNSQARILFEYLYANFSPKQIELGQFGSDSYFSYFLNFDGRVAENQVLRWNGGSYQFQ